MKSTSFYLKILLSPLFIYLWLLPVLSALAIGRSGHVTFIGNPGLFLVEQHTFEIDFLLIKSHCNIMQLDLA